MLRSDPRAILAEAIAEIGDPSWVSEALRFYDSPGEFAQTALEDHRRSAMIEHCGGDT